MSRDNWERLVAAVLKKEQLWQLFHQQSRSPTISSASSDDFVFDLETVSVTPLANPSVSQVSKSVSRPFKEKIFAAWYRRRKGKDVYIDDIPGEEDLGIHLGHVRKISLHELRIATDNFSDENSLDYGHSMVYKGRLADGSPVAVKRYKDRGAFLTAHIQFQTEVEINSIALHPNVLHMLGFCITSKERLIVYPLLANGSVAAWLRGRHRSEPPLSWSVRKGIALGAARGLAYLHGKCDPPIIHRDVKASNILLDEDFEAVVGDFELAIIMDYDVTQATTSVVGTVGHIGPEYLANGTCSDKTDVFGYGAFLLELITGLRAVELAGEGMALHDWIKRNVEERKWEIMADPCCGDNDMEEVVEQLTKIALLCMQSTPERRPKMLGIVRMLEVGDFLAESWEFFHKETFSQEVEDQSYSSEYGADVSTVRSQEVENQSYSLEFIYGDDVSIVRSEELSGPR